jgi:peptidoglycan/LPS O-acetylase OafA/YrhL
VVVGGEGVRFFSASSEHFGETSRYTTLDGLRGVAAIMVVLYHVGSMRDAPKIVPHGYLAVDFFLMLSGFIIATAYAGKLANGLSLAEFFKRRMIRLYPLAFLGLLLGCFKLISEIVVNPGGIEPFSEFVSICVLNVLLIPNLTQQFLGELFPVNPPIWSLFAEILVNIIWCVLKPRIDLLFVILSVSCLLLFYFVMTTLEGLRVLGPDSAYAAGATARVTFCFFLGTLLSRFRSRLPHFFWLSNPVLLSTMLVIVCCMSGAGRVWDLLSIYLFLPIILVGGIGAGTEVDAPICKLLGAISYPLYVVHFPIFLLLSGFRHSVFPALGPILIAVFAVLLSIAVATAVERFYDRPVRNYLSTLLARRARFQRV